MFIEILRHQRRRSLKIAGREHPDRHRTTEDIKQCMASVVDIQLNKLFQARFYQLDDSVNQDQSCCDKPSLHLKRSGAEIQQAN